MVIDVHIASVTQRSWVRKPENFSGHFSSSVMAAFASIIMFKPQILKQGLCFSRGAVASWLVCSTPDQAVWVLVLAGDIALCS